MKFNKECYHKGYKISKVNTYLTAQLFAAPAAGQKLHRLKRMNITGQLSILCNIRDEIQENWDSTYMNAKYNPGKWFQGKKGIKKKTRKIKHDHFPKLSYVQRLIKNFENLHNDMRVAEV